MNDFAVGVASESGIAGILDGDGGSCGEMAKEADEGFRKKRAEAEREGEVLEAELVERKRELEERGRCLDERLSFELKRWKKEGKTNMDVWGDWSDGIKRVLIVRYLQQVRRIASGDIG